MKNTIIKYALVLVSFSFAASCSNYTVISDLANNRMTLIVKGTYETNDPYAWDTPLNTSESFTVAPYGAPINTAVNSSDLRFYIDIANIRIGRKNGKPSGVSEADYWEYFAENRIVLCSNSSDIIGHNLVNCDYGRGVQKLNRFFNEGFEYPATDIPTGTYRHIGIFFRKFVTYPSVLYNAAAVKQEDSTAIFDNRTVYGYDLNSELLQYSISDTDQSNPLMIPLENKDLNLKVKDSTEPYVLEIRIFVKNALMKHVIKYGQGTATEYPLTFVGPADWRYNHNYADQSLGFHLGGNLLMTARIYEENNVGSIFIEDTALAAPGAATAYFVAVKSGDTFTGTSLPYAATSIAAGTSPSEGTITNVTPGIYDIYRTCDDQARNSSGVLTPGLTDGYPETVSAKCSTVTVTKDTTVTASFANCNCP